LIELILEYQVTMSVTIVIPAAACGLIIGKGGERINLLREQTQAKIMLQSKEKAVPGLNERTVTISGSLLNAQMVLVVGNFCVCAGEAEALIRRRLKKLFCPYLTTARCITKTKAQTMRDLLKLLEGPQSLNHFKIQLAVFLSCRQITPACILLLSSFLSGMNLRHTLRPQLMVCSRLHLRY
jgi:hypothetical protein